MKHLNIIKIGGNVLNDSASLAEFLNLFAKTPGHKVLVHGGGREATKLSQVLGIETKMIDGRRVTDSDTIEVVTMVYAGLINKRLVAGLQKRGCNSIGLSGADGACITSERRSPTPIDYGYVGDITSAGVDNQLLTKLIDNGLTPVICAITCDKEGQLLNTNADSVATAVAIALSKNWDTTLTFCFEKTGVLTDVDDETSVVKQIRPQLFEQLKESQIVIGGMLPKITGALKAVEAGVGKVVIKHHKHLNDESKGTAITL